MKIIIRNKKASHEYFITDRYTAGIQLTGTEVKSIKQLKASINEAFCSFTGGDLFIRNMHVSEYANIKYTNHVPSRDRCLLLRKGELNKLSKAIKEKGLTIIPLNVLISDTSFIKIEIGVAKGKNAPDRKESIKERDIKRQLDNN